MPIRFRCAYCNQLMGISRRKAGTVVRCPNCAGQVIVPNPDGSDPGMGKAVAAGGAPAPLFERHDFEDALHSASGGKRGGASPASSPPAPVISSAPAGYKSKEGGGRYDAEEVDFPANLPA